VGGRVSAQGFKALVLPALLAGTSRQPIDVSQWLEGAFPAGETKAGLKALALTGQAMRFQRPSPPSDYAAISARRPSRRLLPEALRPMLVRHFGEGKSATPPHDELALAIALTLERRRLQPHPFDFPRLDGFLHAHAERLGPDACAWVDRDKAVEEKRSYFDIELLDDGNWREATPARRQFYIAHRRRQDAEAARALVEAVWPSEGADLRFRLLQALRPGLSVADQPFLEGLDKDRAPRVRELAARHLSRLPGAAGQNLALKAVLERIVSGKRGVLKRRATLTLELPATVTGESWRNWIAQSFAEVELDELARALGLQPVELIAASARDPRLSATLAILAFRQSDVALARQAYEAIDEPSPWLDSSLFQSMETVEPQARREMAEFVARKGLIAGTLAPVVLPPLFRALGGPLSDGLMEKMLGAPLWSQWCAAPDIHRRAIFAPIAAMCPPAMRSALRQALASIDPAQIAPIPQILDILDAIERVSADE
jgi:hypothetical protein